MPLAISTHDWQPPQKDSATAVGLVAGPWTLCGGTWMHGDHPSAALGYGAKQQPPRGSIPSPKKYWSLGVIIPNMLEHQHTWNCQPKSNDTKLTVNTLPPPLKLSELAWRRQFFQHGRIAAKVGTSSLIIPQMCLRHPVPLWSRNENHSTS